MRHSEEPGPATLLHKTPLWSCRLEGKVHSRFLLKTKSSTLPVMLVLRCGVQEVLLVKPLSSAQCDRQDFLWAALRQPSASITWLVEAAQHQGHHAWHQLPVTAVGITPRAQTEPCHGWGSYIAPQPWGCSAAPQHIPIPAPRHPSLMPVSAFCSGQHWGRAECVRDQPSSSSPDPHLP